MPVKSFRGGYDRNFAYLIWDENTQRAITIDPCMPKEILLAIKQKDLRLMFVINTHNDFDHVSGNAEVMKITSAKLLEMKDNDKKVIDGMMIKCIATPGHTPDSKCYIINEAIFTGDTLFVGKVGGTGNEIASRTQFASLKKLAMLDDNLKIYPGHDYGISPTSTIGNERRNNPFIQRLDSFENFNWLKQNWLQYKKQHNLS